MPSLHSALRKAYMTRYREAAMVHQATFTHKLTNWQDVQRLAFNSMEYYREKIAAIDKQDKEYFG